MSPELVLLPRMIGTRLHVILRCEVRLLAHDADMQVIIEFSPPCFRQLLCAHRLFILGLAFVMPRTGGHAKHVAHASMDGRVATADGHENGANNIVGRAINLAVADESGFSCGFMIADSKE